MELKKVEEVKQPINELRNKILSMGTIKDIVRSEEKIIEILTYPGDRHLFSAFVEMVSDAYMSKAIEREDLNLLSSDWFSYKLINLQETVNDAGRELFPFELGDKLNYATQFVDSDITNKIFTSPTLVKALNNQGLEINFWFTSGSVSDMAFETQLNVAKEIISSGNVALGISFLETISEDMKVHRNYGASQTR